MRPPSPGSAGVLIVFAKEPRPGLVKTRMAPRFSLEDAAAFYACLLDDVLEVSARAGAALALDLVLAVSPAAGCSKMSRRLSGLRPGPVPGYRVVAQHGRDLSERMQWGVAEAGAAGYPRILVRGSDSPLLEEAHLREVLGALEGASLAVTPDQGGGYALIGLRGPVPGLFHHPMSTPEVLAETLRHAEAHGLEAQTCSATLDIDTPEDLELLRSADHEKARRLCPRTLSFLASRSL